MSSMRRGLSRVVLVGWVVLLPALAACGSDDEPTVRAGTEPAPGAPAEGWVRIAPSPLSARAHTVQIWTGEEVLVIGGDRYTCPPGAGCVGPTEPPFPEAAAYDPTTDSWRSIAAPPVPFRYASSAVVGGHAYFLSTGPQVYGDPGADPVATTRLLRYTVANDAWDEVAAPTDGVGWYSLIGAGDRLVAVAGSDERGGPRPSLVLDEATGAWTPLPEDPRTPAFDRTATWLAPHLYVFDKELVPNPGSERPSLVRLARFSFDTGTWERLPDSEVIGYGPWFAEGSLLIDPSQGSADGGQVNNWGRSYPEGGIYDVANGAWKALPGPTDGAEPVGVLGSSSGHFPAGGRLLDATTLGWLEMPTLPGYERGDEIVPVAAGADAFVWGGVRWRDGEATFLDEGWIWRSGRGSATPGGPEPTTTTSAVELTRSGGCADAFFWAADADGTLAVTVSVEARERSTTGETVIEWRGGDPAQVHATAGSSSLPDPLEVRIEVQRGVGLVQPFCNDVVGQPYEVEERLSATARSGRITLGPAPDPAALKGSGHGVLEVTGLVAEDGTVLGDLRIETDQIGFYAG